MEKLPDPLTRAFLNRRDIMDWNSRKKWSTFFLFLCLAAASCPTSSGQQGQVIPTAAPAPAPSPFQNPTDPDQLATFYRMDYWPTNWRGLHGAIPNISNYDIPTRDVCANINKSWDGVRCDGASPYQHIVEITVTDMSGSFPANFLKVLANITTLQFLRVYQKGDKATSSLGGQIPPELGQLVNLQELNFRGNSLFGGVPPEVARLPKLVSINLADNQLTGPVSQFCESTSLQTLLLFDNHFTDIIPPCMGAMNLTNLNIGANNISGPIPDAFANLTLLQSINFDNTTLSGGLPKWIGDAWTNLSSISFLRSNLSGPIPDTLGSLKNLATLNLGMNKLSGAIPPSLGSLGLLTSLSLYDNDLSGEIPPDLGGLKNLTHLLLWNNSFSGSLPPSLGQLSKLLHFHVQGNNLSGALNASMFQNWASLKSLFLQRNNFNGSFPSYAVFNSCMSLLNVSLSYNNFDGPILEPNATLPANLSLLLMSYNKFSGPVPSELGQSSLLQYLDLANNSLTGEVPAEVISKPAQINLAFNSFNVSFRNDSRPGFGLFTCNPTDSNCTEYHAGSNRFVAINVGGPAFKMFEADMITPDNSIGVFKTLASSPWSFSQTGVDGGTLLNRTQSILNSDAVQFWPLYNTARQGADSFTYYIHGLKPSTKYNVDLGFVELMADLRVGERVFDIWIRNQLVFQGMDVMERAPGQFRAFIQPFEVETYPDSGLLTIELRGYGSWPLVFNKRFKQGQYYGPILSSLHVYQKKELGKIVKIAIIAGSAAGGCLIAVAFVLLAVCFVKRRRKLQALKDEHSGLGFVFFRYSELEAATNKWSAKSLIGEGAFGKVYRGVLADGTIIAIKQLVVRSDGPLWTKEAFLNEAKIISTTRHRNLIALLGCCFETNNPMFICEYMPNGSLHDALFVQHIPLNWAQRVAIARDVAHGLLYLHEETVNRIIHRDVKPANILLDEKMNARVADFGLARLVGDQEVDVITNVMGTRGYLAPEYALNGQLSDKVDVYSYGVVLLELVSGRHGLQPSRDLPEPVPISIVQWFWDLVSDNLVLTAADPALDHGFYNEDFIRMAEIGLWCTQSHPLMRPTMSQVTRMLLKQAQVPKLVESRTNYEARDFGNLPVNPFDEREWPSYMAEIPVGKDVDKESSSYKAIIEGPKSNESYENAAVLPLSGVTPR